MRTQSATTTITRAVTVAAGVFAPGHLGELTQYLPFELVDDVLEQTRTVQRRLRDLPSRVGVYFVLALGMFPRLGYARVWGKLTAGLAGLDRAVPVGEGAAGPAPPARPGAAEGPVRGGRRAAGPAWHAGGAVRRAAHGRLRRLQLAQGPRHRPQPLLAGPDPVPDGLCRVSHAAADGAGRDRHPRPARRRARVGGRPGRGHRGPAAAAAAAPGHAHPAGPGLRRQRVPGRGRGHRRAAAGPGQVHPPPVPSWATCPMAPTCRTWTGCRSGSSRPA